MYSCSAKCLLQSSSSHNKSIYANTHLGHMLLPVQIAQSSSRTSQVSEGNCMSRSEIGQVLLAAVFRAALFGPRIFIFQKGMALLYTNSPMTT